ncbi:5-oxoprolinase subunit PxpA [Affinibrenneria salicis]|uniref:5-oxoprolinase subunit PxpA n=2 Tax=Affinibrenneria salicis TaxID=2590031 RepID=A0A5J5FZ71_9GAMM|nr:5-oxoprolinase subunit PxpA [Affinibrenneria salicis]
MNKVDINADMGENLGHWVVGDNIDKKIMPLVSSANIATGFHAGDPNIMRQMVELAKYHHVSVGAHPGFRDLHGFGRRHMHIEPQELINDVIYQIGALREFASLYGVPLRHIKPHGALYMHLAQDEAAARLFITTLHALAPDLLLYCMHGSIVWNIALELEQPVVCEFYADRDYNNSGSIVFTRRVAPPDPAQIARKVLRACQQGKVLSTEGKDIPISFDSICIHSDTPGAYEVLKTTHDLLTASGIKIKSPEHIFRHGQPENKTQELQK